MGGVRAELRQAEEGSKVADLCCLLGYQLTSAECLDLRRGGVVVDQFCQYYPENVKPKPRLQECNPDPCLAR